MNKGKSLIKRRLQFIVFAPVMLVLLCCSVLVGLDAFWNVPVEQMMPTIAAPFVSPVTDAITGGQQIPVQSRQELAHAVDTLLNLASHLVSLPFKMLFIVFLLTLAFIISRFSLKIAHAGFSLYRLLFQPQEIFSRLNIPGLHFNAQHQQTVNQLVASIVSLIVFTVAIFFSLAQFIDGTSLAVVGGLIATGVGFGARVMIGDLLAGGSNIFEDNFDVGEKIEIAHVTGKIDGVVELVTVRVAHIRAESGELFIIPHGEIRILRNFSRGQFSIANISFKVSAVDLEKVLALLTSMNEEVLEKFNDLRDTWRVISETGVLGRTTELTVICRARYGKGAELRLQMLEFIRERLDEAGIDLID